MAKAKRKSGGGGGGLAVLLMVLVAAGAGAWYVATHPAVREHLLHGDEASAPLTPASKPVPNPSPTAATKRLTKKMATVAEDAPFSPSEDVFEAGARTYAAQCAGCHGTVSRRAQKGVTQFWSGHTGTHALDDKSTRVVYETIAAGTDGMPAYGGKLTEVEIWQLSLLLKSSSLELPEPVKAILH